MKMTVIGTGYLGAVHAACMAELGHDVLGVDVDPGKIAALADGRAPFFEPEFPEVLTRGIQSGRLRFTTSLQKAAAQATASIDEDRERIDALVAEITGVSGDGS